MDPARAAAGIITGIGFLGAGTILKGKDFVRGLTTAASIWMVAAIGITTGLGLFFLATVTTVLALFTVIVKDIDSMESRPQDNFMKLAFIVRFKEQKVGFEVITSLPELEELK